MILKETIFYLHKANVANNYSNLQKINNATFTIFEVEIMGTKSHLKEVIHWAGVGDVCAKARRIVPLNGAACGCHTGGGSTAVRWQGKVFVPAAIGTTRHFGGVVSVVRGTSEVQLHHV